MNLPSHIDAGQGLFAEKPIYDTERFWGMGIKALGDGVYNNLSNGLVTTLCADGMSLYTEKKKPFWKRAFTGGVQSEVGSGGSGGALPGGTYSYVNNDNNRIITWDTGRAVQWSDNHFIANPAYISSYTISV